MCPGQLREAMKVRAIKETVISDPKEEKLGKFTIVVTEAVVALQKVGVLAVVRAAARAGARAAARVGAGQQAESASALRAHALLRVVDGLAVLAGEAGQSRQATDLNEVRLGLEAFPSAEVLRSPMCKCNLALARLAQHRKTGAQNLLRRGIVLSHLSLKGDLSHLRLDDRLALQRSLW